MEVASNSKTRTNIILINNGQKTGETNTSQPNLPSQPVKGQATNLLPNTNAIGGMPGLRPQLNSIHLHAMGLM